jgi:hypothetical protein
MFTAFPEHIEAVVLLIAIAGEGFTITLVCWVTGLLQLTVAALKT